MRNGKYGGARRNATRGGRSDQPRTIVRAAEPVCGDEAELSRSGVVAAAGDQDVPEAPERRATTVPVVERQQRMTGASVAVGLQRARVGRGAPLRFAQGRRVRPSGAARRREECAIRLLRRVAEVPVKAVHEDRGAAFGDRERVAPQAQRQPEPEIGAEQRVRALARKVRRRARDAEADGVQLAVQRDAAQLHATEQCLGVRDRRRTRVGVRH